VPFNPTLVRLGQAKNANTSYKTECFQSHFGSIGAVKKASQVYDVDLFQSHFGSIGAGHAQRKSSMPS